MVGLGATSGTPGERLGLSRLHYACSRLARVLQRKIPVASRLFSSSLEKLVSGVACHPLADTVKVDVAWLELQISHSSKPDLEFVRLDQIGALAPMHEP